jgi:hypothetical protein
MGHKRFDWRWLRNSAGEHRNRTNKKPRRPRRGQVSGFLLTICKPTRSLAERGIGPTDWQHTKPDRPGKKVAPSWDAWGRRDCRRAGLSSPPTLRICLANWPSKRGEHSAGPAHGGDAARKAQAAPGW